MRILSITAFLCATERILVACRLHDEPGMQAITRQQLQEKIEAGERFALVEVLEADAYEAAHLPQAMNIPLNENFEEAATRAIPDKSEPVVVYCSSSTCDASPQAAERLEAIGYTNVMDYTNGKKDWKEAGLRLERSR